MSGNRPNPEMTRLLRTAAWLWLGYLAALLLIDLLLYRSLQPVLLYYLANGSAAAIFLGLACWTGLQRRLRWAFLPLALCVIAVLPLIFNHLIPGSPDQRSLASPEGLAIRQLPVLFLALILTAWQYGLGGVILFSVGTAFLEMLVVSVIAPLVVYSNQAHLPPPQGFTPLPFLSIDMFLYTALVRTVSFLVLGAFLAQLLHRLQRQQQSLAEANTRLSQYAGTLESLTISRERNRLAHELHDTLAHSLTALSVQLETVKAYWKKDRSRALRQLENALEATRAGAEETRRALKSLRATPLEDLGLALALRQLAESASQRGGWKLELKIEQLKDAPGPDVEQCIYRIAQESLENIVRHAGAGKVSLQLRQEDRQIVLLVQDDGTGFELPRQEQEGRYGLTGMRERAALAGGRLELASEPGAGTILTLRISAGP